MTPGAGLTVADHAVLRVAGWPLETAGGFAAPELREAAVRSVRRAEILRVRSAAVAEALGHAVPLSDRGTRRWLLAARRALHGGRAAPTPPDDVAGDKRLAGLVADAMALSEELSSLEGQSAHVRSEHLRAYAEQIDRLRAEAGDDRFLKALAVDKPQLAEQWRRAVNRRPGDRTRTRRLHATVFRHLMGATGRSTPRQAWAGIVPVMPAAEPGLHVEPAAAVYRFTPALEPFAMVVERWFELRSACPDWPLRRSPTLLEEADGWWWCEHHHENGVGWQPTDPSAAHRAALTFWADGEPRPAASLLEFADETNGPAARQRIANLVTGLVSAGALVNGASLPAAASDCWDALDRVTSLLPGPVRDMWATTVDAVRGGCADLDRRFAGATVDDVIEARAAIVAQIGALWSAAGLPASPPEPILHVDMIGPWRARWGPDTRTASARDVAAVLSWTAADGAAEAFRRAIVAALPPVARQPDVLCLAVCAAMPAPRVTRLSTLAEAFMQRGCDPAQLEAHWEAELGKHHGRRRHQLSARAPCSAIDRAGPAGSMVFAAGESRWAKWGRPQLGLFSARHLPMMEGVVGPAPPAEHLGLLECVGAVQVWGSDPVSRSTALRPVAPRRVTPHGGPAESLSDVSLHIDDADRIWLRRDGALRRPLYDAPAAIGRHDRASRLLLAAAMSHGWELMAWGVPILAAELERWHHLPRLSLPDGLVLSAERWIIPDEVMSRLAQLDPADRYVGWCDEVEQRKIPSVVLVRAGLDPSAPELLFPTDSPLAVSAILDRLVTGGGPLVLTEVPPDDSAIVGGDPPGSHFLAELAITWVCDASS